MASQYLVQVVGESEEIREPFFSISTERKLMDPELVVINSAAKAWLN